MTFASTMNLASIPHQIPGMCTAAVENKVIHCLLSSCLGASLHANETNTNNNNKAIVEINKVFLANENELFPSKS